MKKLLTIILCLAAMSASAEPLYYLTMTQYVTNQVWTTNEFNPTGYWTTAQGVAVVDRECLTAQAATNQMLALAADPDWFGDDGAGEKAYDATIHQHDHFNPTECKVWECGSHRSNKNAPANIVTLSEDGVQDPDYPTRYLFTELAIDAPNTVEALKKAKKIKNKDGTDKKWKGQP